MSFSRSSPSPDRPTPLVVRAISRSSGGSPSSKPSASSDTAAPYYTAGLHSFSTGDFAAAAECFRVVICHRPHDAGAYYWLSKTTAAVGDIPSAIESITMCAEIIAATCTLGSMNNGTAVKLNLQEESGSSSFLEGAGAETTNIAARSSHPCVGGVSHHSSFSRDDVFSFYAELQRRRRIANAPTTSHHTVRVSSASSSSWPARPRRSAEGKAEEEDIATDPLKVVRQQIATQSPAPSSPQASSPAPVVVAVPQRAGSLERSLTLAAFYFVSIHRVFHFAQYAAAAILRYAHAARMSSVGRTQVSLFWVMVFALPLVLAIVWFGGGRNVTECLRCTPSFSNASCIQYWTPVFY